MAVPLFVVENERQKVYRRRKGLEHLTDADIQKHTGFPPWGVREIIEVLEPCSGQTKSSIPIETKVLCYLSHLRSGSFQWCLGSMAGFSQPSVSRIIDQCLNFTLGLAPAVIKFPNHLQTLITSSRNFTTHQDFRTF
jgi:hypothetical protein